MLTIPAISTARRAPRRELEKFVEGKARRDDTATKIDSDDRLAALAPHPRPQPAEAEDGERMRRDHPLMRYPLYRDVDEPADDDRHHQQQRRFRAQM